MLRQILWACVLHIMLVFNIHMEKVCPPPSLHSTPLHPIALLSAVFDSSVLLPPPARSLFSCSACLCSLLFVFSPVASFDPRACPKPTDKIPSFVLLLE